MQVLEDANLLHGESFDEEEYIWWTYLLSSLYNKEDLAKKLWNTTKLKLFNMRTSS